MKILDSAKNTLRIEGESLLALIEQLDENFVRAVECILAAEGRLVLTGIGKSANIAHKIVASMNSTGQPSLFMHAADALHGDLGNVQKGDVVLCLSNSGNTEEICALIPLIRTMGNPIIAITGNKDSQLAKDADFVISSYVENEACPNNLAPTSSTTAQLALGDALAVCLLEARNFSPEDFARYHPGGNLGKRLYLRVGDLSSRNQKPQVSPEQKLTEVVIEISEKRLGACAVVENNTIIGVITDGDIRRALQRNADLREFVASDLMSLQPKSISSAELATKALELMEKHNITQLVVLEEGKYAGFVHLHDLLKEGIF